MPLKGEAHPRAKLNTEQVLMIRKLYDMGFSISVISKNYKVSSWTIRNVIKHETWNHI